MSIVARLRALGWVILAVLYFWFAGRLAATAASGFMTSRGNGFILLDWIFLLLLLLIGFSAMGYIGQRQQHPIVAMGLGRRPGWAREVLLGAAIGWSGMIACVLPMACAGALYVEWVGGWHSIGSLILDFVILCVASLAEEVAFRGYPFQRLIEAVGPGTATLLAALSFAAVHMGNPNSSGASTLVTLLAGWLLAVAYLRTRALWVGWGFHLAWNVVMAILFGLPVSGLTSFSPFFSTSTYGPFWLTGGNYGPEGSATAIVVLFVLIFVMMSATRHLKYQYAIPPIVSGGMPVDIDEMARRQHEAAMSTAPPKAPALIQIGTMPGAISRPIASTSTLQTQSASAPSTTSFAATSFIMPSMPLSPRSAEPSQPERIEKAEMAPEPAAQGQVVEDAGNEPEGHARWAEMEPEVKSADEVERSKPSTVGEQSQSRDSKEPERS